MHDVRYDLARGVAALVVFAAHVSQVFLWSLLTPGSWLEIASGTLARVSVLVFFVLSGLLITRSITANIKRYGAFDSRDYLTSRVARIYPPFLLALAITMGVAAAVKLFGLPGSDGALGTLRPDGLHFGYSEVWKSLLLYDGLTSINGPLWTLYIEVNLYVVAMGVALILRGRNTTLRLIGILVAVAAILLGRHSYGYAFFALVWVFGAALNFITTERTRLFSAVCIVFIAIASLIAPVWPGSYLDGSRLSVGLQAGACVIFAWLYLRKTWAERPWPKTVMDSADYSYTLYVIHFPILAFGLSLTIAAGINGVAGSFAVALLTGCITWAIAKFASPFVENTALFKKLLSTKIKGRNASVAR